MSTPSLSPKNTADARSACSCGRQEQGHCARRDRMNEKGAARMAPSFCGCGRLPRFDLSCGLLLNFLWAGRRPEPFPHRLEGHVERWDGENTDEGGQNHTAEDRRSDIAPR